MTCLFRYVPQAPVGSLHDRVLMESDCCDRTPPMRASSSLGLRPFVTRGFLLEADELWPWPLQQFESNPSTQPKVG